MGRRLMTEKRKRERTKKVLVDNSICLKGPRKINKSRDLDLENYCCL